MTRVVAGIDASKAKLDVHLDGKDWALPNDRDGFRAIAKWFRDAGVERVVPVAPGTADAAAAHIKLVFAQLDLIGGQFGGWPPTTG